MKTDIVLPLEIDAKWQALLSLIASLGSAAVAFSGGVDSGLLATASFIALADQMAAFTVRSPVNPDGEEESALTLAKRVGFRHILADFDDLAHPDFVANSAERCYFCKLARFRALQSLAAQQGLTTILEGSNADDGSDYRPGRRAVSEVGARSPLAEVGLKKQEIRFIAQALDLPVWDRPSAPCLATRFPYGSPITAQGIRIVAQGENFLKLRGFNPCRMRHLGDTVRLEVSAPDIERLTAFRAEIVPFFKSLGFTYITLDLQGYRQGSMNEVLTK